MKNIFTGVFLGILGALILSCNPKKEETAKGIDKEQIKAEIIGLEEAYAAAFNERNAEGVLAYYAEDATSFSNGKAPMAGKKAIRESIQKDFESTPKGTVISFETKEVHVSNDGKQVVEMGSYKAVDPTTAKVMSGHFMSLFEKRDGKYICVRDMAVSDQPVTQK